MKFFETLALATFLSSVAAAPAAQAPVCTEFMIPVTATAPVKLINQGSIPQNLDNPTVLVDFILSGATSGLAAVFGAAATITTNGTFNMAARYCEPANYNASRATTIHYLQHAILNTKEYWNGLTKPVGVDGAKYSYVDYASNEGYPTIAIDNLGNGMSDHPDPILVTQMSLQVEIIHQILMKLRAGTVGGPLAGRAFNKIIYTGHSYGSICGNALATIHPEDVDTFILTGYSGEFAIGAVLTSVAGLPAPAALTLPRFSNLPVGYLAQTSEPGRIYAFYTVGNVGGFDMKVADVDFANRGTVAIGEIATLFYGLGPADAYTGNVFVITGKQDAAVCNNVVANDCGSGATSKIATAGKFFPNANDYSFIIPDATGHSANLHYSAQASFRSAFAYLAGKGF